MNQEKLRNDLRKLVTTLGKEVAESHSTTQFPEWIHFKIGISELEGLPLDMKFWESKMSLKTIGSSQSNNA